MYVHFIIKFNRKEGREEVGREREGGENEGEGGKGGVRERKGEKGREGESQSGRERGRMEAEMHKWQPSLMRRLRGAG